jgi:putative addiction module component (TIGR02574 family)
MDDARLKEVVELGKALGPEERSRLIDILLESLHEHNIVDVDAAWELEIERRLVEYDGGKVSGLDAEDVFSKARSIAR